MTILLSFFYMLRDIIVAASDIVLRRRHRCYRYSETIDAPIDVLRASLHSNDVTYRAGGIRVVQRYPEPHDLSKLISETFVGGELYATVAIEKLPSREPDEVRYRYMRRADDPHASYYGRDDVLTVRLKAVGDTATRLEYERELTHLSAKSRITAPMGLRTAAWLEKTEAETKFRAQSPTKMSPRVRSAGRQLLWALAAFASFAWLIGWREALILMVLIALHEAGHALAMIWFGVGVGFVGFVPFFGGMAAPKRNYTSEFQNAVVALAGPGLSLIPTGLLVWAAIETQHHWVITAAFLFAIVNGFNLVPIPPLDGGVILRSVLGSFHPSLGIAVSWLGAAVIVALAAYFQSVLLGLVAVFAVIQAVAYSSFDVGAHRRRLGWVEGGFVTAGLIVVIAVYVVFAAIIADVRRDSALRERAGSIGPVSIMNAG